MHRDKEDATAEAAQLDAITTAKEYERCLSGEKRDGELMYRQWTDSECMVCNDRSGIQQTLNLNVGMWAAMQSVGLRERDLLLHLTYD